MELFSQHRKRDFSTLLSSRTSVGDARNHRVGAGRHSAREVRSSPTGKGGVMFGAGTQ